VIDGNVRYGMEMLCKEDMRYIPCHGCSAKSQVQNALLAEITARHDTDGHRFFTLTPAVTDMSGPIIANSVWIPGHDAMDGFVGHDWSSPHASAVTCLPSSSSNAAIMIQNFRISPSRLILGRLIRSRLILICYPEPRPVAD
jgi:hypothetical protein